MTQSKQKRIGGCGRLDNTPDASVPSSSPLKSNSSSSSKVLSLRLPKSPLAGSASLTTPLLSPCSLGSSSKNDCEGAIFGAIRHQHRQCEIAAEENLEVCEQWRYTGVCQHRNMTKPTMKPAMASLKEALAKTKSTTDKSRMPWLFTWRWW